MAVIFRRAAADCRYLFGPSLPQVSASRAASKASKRPLLAGKTSMHTDTTSYTGLLGCFGPVKFWCYYSAALSFPFVFFPFTLLVVIASGTARLTTEAFSKGSKVLLWLSCRSASNGLGGITLVTLFPFLSKLLPIRKSFFCLTVRASA